MAVIKQTAASGTDFDGTPDRGFVDLADGAGEFKVDTVNTSRRYVINLVGVNCLIGTIISVRMVLALNKAGADGIDHFAATIVQSDTATEWIFKGPLLVPNGYSLFIFSTHAGPETDCRLLIAGGVITRESGFNF